MLNYEWQCLPLKTQDSDGGPGCVVYGDLTGVSINMRRDIFQAIADPTRRAIISLIALQAMTPNALADNFHTTRQAVSKHLRILTECELVKQEYKGREIYYSLEVDKMKEIDEWLEQFRKLWETRFSQLEDLLATMKNQTKGK